MRVYRISKPEYVPVALQGHGSAIAPGRWNSSGVRIGYTASSVALAMLEMLVHVNKEDVPAGLRHLTYEVPDEAVFELPSQARPPGWSELPCSDQVRHVGDSFVRSGLHLAMRVPSAVARGEFNILVNPAHARFVEVELVGDEPLALDQRLFE
jgi:RES domain-containing protein